MSDDGFASDENATVVRCLGAGCTWTLDVTDMERDDALDELDEHKAKAHPNGPGVPVLAEEATVDVRLLARRHTRRAIERLAELMELQHPRQAMVVAMSSRALIDLAHPDLTDEMVKERVEATLKEMLAEAEARKQLAAAGSSR